MQNSILEQVKVNKYLKIFLKISEVILGKTDKKKIVTLSGFWLLRGYSVWVNPFEKENLRQKAFSDNVE